MASVACSRVNNLVVEVAHPAASSGAITHSAGPGSASFLVSSAMGCRAHGEAKGKSAHLTQV
jgi:hypothetical protein